jgi:TonB family protein
MALTGQLSDMSLAELIEFFCNQRKTGRLKIDYPRGHSVFFIKEGELVDAKVGSLSGPDAVYFSLTLPNAAFDFSPEVEPTRRTIKDSWQQVVLEGLRRLDEGLSPTESDAFGNFSPNEADMAAMFDQVERLGESAKQEEGKRAEEKEERFERAAASEGAPLSMMVDSATENGGGRKKWVAAGVGASLVLACAVVAIPLATRSTKSPETPAAAAQPAPESSSPDSSAQAPDGGASADAQPAPAAETPAPADEAAARREREERERRERRERERREEARREEAAKAATTPAPAAAGPKSVRVAVTYDEAGRVTQASVAGATPGAEAFGGTAVRIARGRRFPAGKPGSTVVTIPVN